MAYKKRSIKTDRKFEDNLIDIRAKLGQMSEEETFKLGVAILKIAVEARDEEGLNLTLSDSKNRVVRQITIPGSSVDF